MNYSDYIKISSNLRIIQANKYTFLSEKKQILRAVIAIRLAGSHLTELHKKLKMFEFFSNTPKIFNSHVGFEDSSKTSL